MKYTGFKGPDLTSGAASLRQSVQRELAGLRTALSGEKRETVRTKSEGLIKKVEPAKTGKSKRKAK
jgi:hypothetical protein